MQTTQSIYDRVFLRNDEGVKKKNKVFVFILFLISPFLSLIVAMRNYRSSWSKNVVWLFVAFYGYTMVISNDSMDANRYRDKFLQMAQAEITFTNFAVLLYDEDTRYVDIAQPLITYAVSLFTSDYKILFFVFALIFGYFYSRNIWYVINYAGPKIKIEAIILVFTFAIIIGFWQINGFRMWTAAHIFFFGAIQYLLAKKKKGIVIAFLSIFVHFSFALPVLVLLAYILVGNRVHLYFFVFVITFFITEINLNAINQTLSSFVPDIFMDKVDTYASENNSQRKSGVTETRSWHARYYGRALKFSIIVLVTVIYFKSLNFLKSYKFAFSLFCFSLLFLAISNLVSLIPSGGRFVTLASLFAIAAVFLTFQNVPPQIFIKRMIVFMTPVLFFYCVVAFRIGMDTIGAMAILGNPILASFMEVDIAIIEFIK